MWEYLVDLWTDFRDHWDVLGSARAWSLIALTLGVGLGIAALCAALGRIVIGPLRRRAEKLQAPKQYQLSDVFWLLVQFQLALAYVVRQVGVEQLAYFFLVLGFLVLATVGMWAGAMSFMSRAGVQQPLRRAVFILFLLPLTLTLMIATAYVVIVMPASLLVDRLTGHGLLAIYLGTNELQRRGWWLATLLIAVFALAAFGLRQLAFWILRDGGEHAARRADEPTFDVLGEVREKPAA